MNAEQALVTGVLVLSGVVGLLTTAELATRTADTALHAVDTGAHIARDVGVGGGAGIGTGVTVTVAIGRRTSRKGK